MYCTVTQESKSELQVLQHGFKCLWGNFSVLVLLVEEAPVAPRAGTLLCAACGAVWRLGLCAHLRQQTQMSVGVLVFGMQQCSPAVCWLWAVVCLSFLFDFLTLVFDPMIFSAEWVKWLSNSTFLHIRDYISAGTASWCFVLASSLSRCIVIFLNSIGNNNVFLWLCFWNQSDCFPFPFCTTASHGALCPACCQLSSVFLLSCQDSEMLFFCHSGERDGIKHFKGRLHLQRVSGKAQCNHVWF